MFRICIQNRFWGQCGSFNFTQVFTRCMHFILPKCIQSVGLSYDQHARCNCYRCARRLNVAWSYQIPTLWLTATSYTHTRVRFVWLYMFILVVYSYKRTARTRLQSKWVIRQVLVRMHIWHHTKHTMDPCRRIVSNRSASWVNKLGWWLIAQRVQGYGHGWWRFRQL